ncbi:MGH1-like glycoside hydrolase domain-containing protein [Primorskyibacter sp. 2E233]|uniref:MGH1-like glycoside hydrolase domain-containing protein n=1 Tax=Primorskyibacter sp. 2E233 TaxID=3413431 RepID=UPI003BF0B21B
MDHISMDEQARAILRGNDRGGYTVPTAGLYPYQWNWDSAFAAWGFAQFDIPRAWQELETLFSGQWPSGMVPHILFHKPDPGYFPGPDVWGAEDKGPIPSSGVSQPPVAASFVRAVFEKDPSAGKTHLRGLFGKLVDWHRWFMTWRCDGGAIFITHPWEAGRDNAPDWDEAMAAIDPQGVGEYTRRDTSHVDPAMRPTKEDYDRYIWLVQRGRRLGWDDAKMAEAMPFKVADPTMTFILLRANRDLAALADALGEDRSEIDSWTAQLETGAARLRNASGVFDGINLNTGNHTGHVSCASFLCWYGGVESNVMQDELKQAFEACAYPIPSHKTGTEIFNPKRYWRGPTWAILNALIGRGLAEMGHDQDAARLCDLTRELIARHGFAEYFDPMTGDPAGGGTFTWTAAVWLAWASPSAGGV